MRGKIERSAFMLRRNTSPPEATKSSVRLLAFGRGTGPGVCFLGIENRRVTAQNVKSVGLAVRSVGLMNG